MVIDEQQQGKRPRPADKMEDGPLPVYKTIAETSDFLADVIGEESQKGKFMQAGVLLDTIDSLAGRIAYKYSGGSVVTLSFDRVDLLKPVLQLDLVRLEGRLIFVGNSSMVVEIKGFRHTITSNIFQQVCLCYVTMVAVSADTGRPRTGLPLLKYTSDEEIKLKSDVLNRKERAKEWAEIQAHVDGLGPLKAAEIEDPLNLGKREYFTIKQTEVVTRRQFLPRHVNHHNTIFGGDILLWMDSVATYTARNFTRSPYMKTISMNRIFFKKPLYISDIVEMRARVVYVRTYVLEVEINVNLERANGEKLLSHSGFFTILNADETWMKQRINNGLKLEDDDQESLKSYLKAKERFTFWRDHETSS